MMRNKWFGPAAGAQMAKLLDHAQTPVGDACYICQEPIKEDDSGILLLNLCSELAGKEDRSPVHIHCLLEKE